METLPYMEEKVDIVALGELLIDFKEAGHSQGGRKLFEQNPGGAPANLLTVASHFGYRTSFSDVYKRQVENMLNNRVKL